MKTYKINDKKVVDILSAGGVGVLPTDTLYGIVCSALSKKAVERVYEIRERNLRKPSIILISCLDDLKLFGIKLDPKSQKELDNFWPGKVSVVLACPSKKFAYLHRQTDSLAFRLPDKKALRNLLKKTGPLIAPSANLEGLLPATVIKEAKDYFEDCVDFYVSGGRLESMPSTIIDLKKGKMKVLREGAVKVKK
jgi:L-threonylcarbamoyladenylate synthase